MADDSWVSNPAAQCFGKEAFVSPQLARKVAERLHRSRRHQGRHKTRNEAYRCPHCGRWHLGSRPLA